MVALSSLLKSLTGASAQPTASLRASQPSSPAVAEPSAEEVAIFNLKASLLENARATAKERGARPSLEDYRAACEQFSTTEQGKTMIASGQWKPAIYADISGQNLNGFLISDPTGKIANAKNHDFMNLDSDGAISDFYTNINFNDANLKNCFVEPATSFNEEIARASSLEGITFSGMSAGETFVFGKGAHYTNIRLENINDGSVVFNGSVDGVHLSGKQASISIGDYANVNHVKTTPGFSILHLDIGKGAALSSCDLRECTMSMTSHFEPGCSFQNVALGSNINGLDLSGVKLSNVSVDGKAITDPSQLPSGVTYDAHTTASASAEFIMQCAAQQAVAAGGVQNFSWNPEMRNTAPETSAQAPQESITAPPTNPLAAIRATMQEQLQTIGRVLTPEEQRNLDAINEAREQRSENSFSMAPRL